MALNDGKAAIRISGFGGRYPGAAIGAAGIGLVDTSTPAASAQHMTLANDTTVAIPLNDGVAAVDVLVFAGGYPGATIGTAGPGLVSIRRCRVD